jgi:sugar phosphate isomerase/epimerase
MKLAFGTLGCPDWTIDEVVAKAADYGYEGVELRGVLGEHIAPDEKPAEKTRIRGLFEAAGVEIAAINAYTRFASADEAERAGQVKELLAFIDLAAELGSPVVRTFGGAIPDGNTREEAEAWIADALNEVAPRAEAAGVLVALETHDHFTLGTEVAGVLEKVPSAAIGVCWDFANGVGRETLEESHGPIAGRVHHVHVKDHVPEGEDHKYVFVGEGQVDIARAVEILAADGYDRYLSLEWETKWKPELAPPEEAFPQFVGYMRNLIGS